MREYMLILRDHEERWYNFSQDDLRRIVDKYAEWQQHLVDQDRLVDAGRLTDDYGGTVRPSDEGYWIDGPFAEAKEAVAGYFRIRAESQEEAYALAALCPILTYGGSVEVRVLFDPSDSD